MKKNAKLTIFLGSSQGLNGNGAKLVPHIQSEWSGEVETIVLADTDINDSFIDSLKNNKNDAFLFITGTYWDSWGAPLQRFLEKATPLEGSKFWLGKPAGVIVLEHSVGGKGILSRLQGVLVTQGCLVPPMSGMVLSLVSQLASVSSFADDFWSLDDLNVVLSNLELAALNPLEYKTWNVDRADPTRNWIDISPLKE